MKKISLVLFVLFNFTSFSATIYKDGIYSVVADKGTFGWKPVTEITIKNGKISEIIFDRVNKNGNLASKDNGYNSSMKKKTGTNPAEYSVNIPKNFFSANQNFDKMDAVAGATDSLIEFKIMTSFLLDKASKGEIGKFEIAKSKLKN